MQLVLFSSLYLRLFYIFDLFLTKLNLQKGKLYRELRQVLQRMRLHFQTALTNMVIWKLQTKILYILGHTDNDKDRLQHPEQQM